MKVITDEATKSFNQALYESDWVEQKLAIIHLNAMNYLFKNFSLLTKFFFPAK